MKDAKDAYAVGLIDSPNVKGIYDLKILNEILKAKGEADDQGLGRSDPFLSIGLTIST